jgi:MFS family permease
VNRTFRSLRGRNFRLFFFGQLVSMTGFWMQSVAELWLVLRLTDSGLALGATTALHFAPMLLGGAYGGVVADRVDKRRLLLLTQSAQAALALTLGLLTATGAVRLWMVYVLALLVGCVTAVDNPTRRSFVYEMVGPDELSNAVSLNSTLVGASRIIGPAVAGILIAAVGLSSCFFVNAVSFLAVLGALAAMDGRALHRTPAAPRAPGQLREGIRYAWSTPGVRLPLVMMAVIGTLAFNFQVVIPLLAKEEFGGGAGTFGGMLSVASVGSLAGALFTASRKEVGGRLLVMTAAAMGLAILAASAAPNLVVAVPALVAVGAAGASFIAASNAVVQGSAAPEMQGRVMALHSILFLGSTPVGGPLVGWVASVFGARVAFGLGGVAALLTGLTAWRAQAGTVRPPAPAEEPGLAEALEEEAV